MVSVSQALEGLFPDIDTHARAVRTVEATVKTMDNRFLHIFAGGPGVTAFPAEPSFTAYEVVADTPMPRHWARYELPVAYSYGMVPRLAISEWVTAHGGISNYVVDVGRRMGLLTVRLYCAPEAQKQVLDAMLVGLESAHVPHRLNGANYAPPALLNRS